LITAVRLLVILVTFPTSDPTPAWVLPEAQSIAAQVEAYYAEQSYGVFTLTSDVVGVYTIDVAQNGTRQDIATKARAAAAAAGIDLSTYRYFLYISPTTNFVGGGWGDAQGAWIATAPGYPDPSKFRTWAHELGHHMLGLQHAHGRTCLDGAAAPIAYGDQDRKSTCTDYDYGNTVDVMGNGQGHFNAIAKEQLGWLSILPVTQSGDYVLAPLESPVGLRAIAVPAGFKSPFWYIVEYRQPIGFDANLLSLSWLANPSAVFDGILVHLQLNGSTLLEMGRPDPTSRFADMPETVDVPALRVGQTWCAPSGRLSLTPVLVSAAGALVRVSMRHCR
jgi:hypothetical protein